MKKTLVFGIAAVPVFLFAAACGIHAYFTDADTATNAIPIGYNEIVPVEEFDLEKGVKTPRAKNTGDVDCFIRARYSWSDDRAGKEGLVSIGNENNEEVDENNWEYENGWWYYLQKLSPGEESLPLFTKIDTDAAVFEKYPALTLDVVFESVQAGEETDAISAFSQIEAS